MFILAQQNKACTYCQNNFKIKASPFIFGYSAKTQRQKDPFTSFTWLASCDLSWAKTVLVTVAHALVTSGLNYCNALNNS